MARKPFIQKTLWFLTGEDTYILEQSEEITQERFSIIGLFVFIILMLSSISTFYGIYYLLESIFFEFAISLYVTIFFLFLFLLILYTLTKNVLPVPKSLHQRFYTWVSIFIRLGFLMVLAFLVSQPIEFFLFSNQIRPEFQNYKLEMIQERNLQLNKEYLYELNALYTNRANENEIKSKVDEFYKKKENTLKEFENYIDHKNFFIVKMGLIDTHLWYAWLITAFVMFIFIFPFYLKFKIPNNSSYYLIKRKIQKGIINKHHTYFVNEYNKQFQQKFPNLELKYKTPYKDAPYNTKLKKKAIPKSNESFLNWLFDDSN